MKRHEFENLKELANDLFWSEEIKGESGGTFILDEDGESLHLEFEEVYEYPDLTHEEMEYMGIPHEKEFRGIGITRIIYNGVEADNDERVKIEKIINEGL